MCISKFWKLEMGKIDGKVWDFDVFFGVVYRMSGNIIFGFSLRDGC